MRKTLTPIAVCLLLAMLSFCSAKRREPVVITQGEINYAAQADYMRLWIETRLTLLEAADSAKKPVKVNRRDLPPDPEAASEPVHK